MAKKIRILSIDGGGIRGIIPGMLLVGLEEKLKAESGNSEARIADYFDLVAGTSTGGILGCVVLYPGKDGRPKYTAREAVDVYLKKGGDIFDVPTWHKIKTAGGLLDEKYPSKGIEGALNQYLGNDVMLSQLLKPTVITSYNIQGAQPFFFKQHKAKTDPGAEFMVKDVARATSAAPTYFECANTRSFDNQSWPLIDGGVFVNNPSLCAYAEARTMTYEQLRPGENFNGTPDQKPISKDMLVFSLGTASSTKSYAYNKAKDWGVVEWLQPLIGIMMSGVSQDVDYQMKQIFNATGSDKSYVRINPFIGQADSAMDNATPENLEALRKAGEDNVERYDSLLTDLAKELIKSA